jgi:hypothetical protein
MLTVPVGVTLPPDTKTDTLIGWLLTDGSGISAVIVVIEELGIIVGVDVAVGVDVGVAVDETDPSVTTNCGESDPSRDEKVTPSVPSATSANVYVPFPFTRAVTSYSTQVARGIAPLLSDAPLSKAGRVFQITPPVPDSIQLLLAR